MTTNETTVKLVKSITTHKGELSEIVLREPTAGAFVKFGQPFKVRVKGDDFELDFEDKATMGFLAECSGIDEILLRDLSARDYMKCRTALAHLVLGIAGESPTAPSAE